MVELLKRQQRLWQLMEAQAGLRPMLRLSRSDDCFWVCDLPRRCSETVCRQVQQAVEAAGYRICPDEQAKLWQIDLWQKDALFAPCDEPLLPLPRQDALHPVYGLYRLLMAHPAPVCEQPMELVRGLVKLTAWPKREQEAQTARLAAQCSARLNRKQPLPSAAAYALAQYIRQEDET